MSLNINTSVSPQPTHVTPQTGTPTPASPVTTQTTAVVQEALAAQQSTTSDQPLPRVVFTAEELDFITNDVYKNIIGRDILNNPTITPEKKVFLVNCELNFFYNLFKVQFLVTVPTRIFYNEYLLLNGLMDSFQELVRIDAASKAPPSTSPRLRTKALTSRASPSAQPAYITTTTTSTLDKVQQLSRKRNSPMQSTPTKPGTPPQNPSNPTEPPEKKRRIEPAPTPPADDK